MTNRSKAVERLGRYGPAGLLASLILAVFPAPASAQAQRATRPAAATTAMPDQLTLAKLLWSTMAAVDQANKTGNYSVLRDLGSPGFQTNNSAATLASTFAGIRVDRIDLSDTLLVAPVHEFPPALIEPGVLRMRGRFNLRPVAIGFDLIYQWNNGWMLHGIAVQPFPLGSGGAR